MKYLIYMRFRSSKKDKWTRWLATKNFERVGNLKDADQYDNLDEAIKKKCQGNKHPMRGLWQEFKVKSVKW